MCRHCAWLMTLALLAPPASAFDVGDPWFREPGNPHAFRIEAGVDWARRNVRMEHDHVLIGTPSTGPTAYFINKPADTYGSTRFDYLKARFSYAPIGIATFHFDIGLDGETRTGDSVRVLGGAAHVLLIEQGPFALSSQFGATFVPNVTDQYSGESIIDGPYNQHFDFSASEYGTALLASMKAPCSENLTVLTYGGPRLSAYRERHSSYVDFDDTGDRMWFDGVAKHRSLFGLVLGTRLDWGERWSARVEGRLIEEESLTATLISSY